MLGMPPSAPRRRRWLAPIAVVVLVALAGIAVFHAPPVRARALAMLISRLARAGVVARADRLDYNLATLDVRLHRVTLAATAVPDTPFLIADDVHATLGWSVLIGRIDVTVLEAAHPRIVPSEMSRAWNGSRSTSHPPIPRPALSDSGWWHSGFDVEWDDRRADSISTLPVSLIC